MIRNGPWEYDRMMDVHLAEDLSTEQQRELSYFAEAAREMMTSLSEHVVDPARVVVTYHPHFLGASKDQTQNDYNDVLSATLREAARETGVSLVDCTGHVEEIHGSDYEDAFLWPEDPFSHLTDPGFRRYGAYVAQTVRSVVDSVLSGTRGEVVGSGR
jgi:hypothetical protein